MAEQEQKSSVTCTKIKIKAAPKTKPDVNEHFEVIKDVKLAELKEDECLLQAQYISGIYNNI